MALCLVGTRWGSYLGAQLRGFYRGPLIACGKDPARTRRAGKALKADDCIVGWKNAVGNRDIDTMILALPPQMHAQVAKAAADAGKHVFVEKPLATSSEEADEMIEAGRRNNVVMFTGENVPYRPAIRMARQLMSQIGEPRLLFASSLNTLRDRSATQLTCGILLDFSVHYIRAVRCLFGEPDSIFAAQADRRHIHTPQEDNVTFVLMSESGWQATLAFSWQAAAGLVPELILTGSRGALKIWPDNASVDVYPLEPTRRSRMINKVRPWWLKESLSSPEDQRCRYSVPREDRMGYRAELKDFLATVQAGKADVSSAEEARRDLEIVMAGYESLSRGGPVDCSPRRRFAEPVEQAAH